MAESSAAFILNKIDNFVSKELSLRGSNEEGIKLLRNVHKSITGALKSVDAHMEQDGQNRERIQQLRGINHEIESVLVMYEYRKAEEKTKHWYNRGAIWKDHPIAKEIQKIQTELKDFRENMGAYRLESHPASASTSIEHEAGIAPLYIPESDIVGVEGPRKDLVSWVLDVDRAYGVMFVVGMGGSGKTALVKVVYEQLKTDFDCHVWLTASMFEKTEELLSTMYSKLCNQTGQSSSTSSSHDLIDMLRNYLQDKRYLIVVDNWNRKDWESVKYAFPKDKKDKISRVIITTRRGDIASSCRDTSVDIYKIPPLPCEKAQELFCRKAFPGSRVYPSVPGVPEASERLLKECEGLPLGIIEMGKLLSSKSISKSRIEDLENKLRAELKLNSGNSGNPGQLSRITQVLLSSYNELPYNLKCCFLYMTMFPKEHPVKRGMLIRLWMAEDFITREDGKEPEDIGEEYLEALTGRNLIQDELGFDGKPRAYRVHNLMHKIALSLAESFCTIGVDIPKNPRRLSVQNSELNKLNKGLHHLSTFFVSSLCTNSPEDKKKIPPIPRGIIPSMRHLKILHLDNTKVDALPKGIKELLLLKYLSLCDTDIKQIPISTVRLELLETLNLKQTFVTVLPDSLTTLEKLRYLAVCRIDHRDPIDAVRGFKAPTGIRNLTNLQKLSYVIADRDHNLIKELQNLTKLRKLGIVDLPSDSGPLLCKTIQKLTSLRSLSMQTPETLDQLPEIQGISNPPPLQRLYLWGRLQKMPDWISDLHELIRIRLKWSRLAAANNPMTILGKLNNLLELQLLDAYDGNRLDFHARTFLKLKILEFDQMEQLQMVMIGNGAIPCLQKLSISRCHNLRENPTGIANITQLKELHLRDMPADFANPLKRNGPLHHFGQHIKIIEEKVHS